MASEPTNKQEITPAWHRNLLLAAALLTYLLITLGGVVCVTQSGKSCPDWPGCFGRIIPPPQVQVAAAGFAPPVIRPQSVMPHLGKPTPLHLRYAVELRNSIPESVQSAAREPLAAVALVYAILLSPDDATRAEQLEQLALQTTTNLFDPTSWVTLTNMPAMVNVQNTVTNSMGGSEGFYRLIPSQ